MRRTTDRAVAQKRSQSPVSGGGAPECRINGVNVDRERMSMSGRESKVRTRFRFRDGGGGGNGAGSELQMKQLQVSCDGSVVDCESQQQFDSLTRIRSVARQVQIDARNRKTGIHTAIVRMNAVDVDIRFAMNHSRPLGPHAIMLRILRKKVNRP